MTDHTTPGPPQEPPRPNDLLAAQVADALVAAALIDDQHRAALLSKLQTGGVSQDDWNLWIYFATAPETQEPEAGDG